MGNPQDTTPDASAAPAAPTEPPPRGAKPNTLPPDALELATKLFDAARAGNHALLTQYLSAGIPPNLTNHKGDTLLMLASYHGHVETVQLLLAKGADVNSVNERGQSILAGAVFKGYEGVVRELVGAGADVNGGQPTAVEAARLFRREDLLRLMGVEEEGEGQAGAGGG